jgi:hypothetical protein
MAASSRWHGAQNIIRFPLRNLRLNVLLEAIDTTRVLARESNDSARVGCRKGDWAFHWVNVKEELSIVLDYYFGHAVALVLVFFVKIAVAAGCFFFQRRCTFGQVEEFSCACFTG